MAGDVADKADMEALIDGTVAHFGRIDIVVNNAGGITGHGMVREMSDEAWLGTIGLNLNSAFWTTRPVPATAFDTTIFTSASASRSSIPYSPRWSLATLVTSAARARATPSPRRRMPPRATSRIPTSTRRSRSTVRAPFGPE